MLVFVHEWHITRVCKCGRMECRNARWSDVKMGLKVVFVNLVFTAISVNADGARRTQICNNIKGIFAYKDAWFVRKKSADIYK